MAEPRIEAIISKLRAERRCEGYSWVALVGLADHPGGLGGGVPELEPALVGADLVAPEGDCPATRKLRCSARIYAPLPAALRSRRGVCFDFHLGPPCLSSVPEL